MAKSNNRRTTRPAKKRKTKKDIEAARARNYFLSGLIFVILGIFGALKLGFLGTFIANIFRAFTGQFYGILALLTILYGLVIAFTGAEPTIKNKKRWLGIALLYLGCLIFLQGWFLNEIHVAGTESIQRTWQILISEFRNSQVKLSVGGGLIGAVLFRLTFFLGGKFGSYLFAVLFCGVGAGLIAGVKWQQVQEAAQLFGKQAHEKAQETREKAAERRAQRQAEQAEQAKNQVREPSQGEKLARAVKEEESQNQAPTSEQLALKIENYQQNQRADIMEDAGPIKRGQTTSEKLAEVTDEVGDDGQPLDFAIAAEVEDRDYQLPESHLLDAIPQTDQSNEYSTIEKNVGVLEQTFKSFGVDAKVIRASLGPSVTKYEIQPAVGVKVSKIVNLSDDLALALAAKDIRIEAPIPGKSLVGVEVPNQTISMVSFRDVIESQSASEDHLLEVPLGRDISGSVISADLAKMPHMLIAGSTGSGKSVCINGIITSILMRAKPHEVKLMMVDPKMVELNVYNGIPHLLTPVVTNPRKASQALHKVVEEMERRYELFANTGVRNITGYNQLVQRQNAEMGKVQPILPFIVVIVDELADLMMVASNEVEDAIIRLAQMARAAGIHMILATQRPSVDVITGIIKANVPSRIAFAVSSGTDSRTIIDSNGAEKLLGRGDMLFMPMGENKPVRVQGAFISDQEVERIVAAVTEQQGADYQENMMPTEESEQATGESEDELYPQVLQLVIDMQTASASLIQRRFKVGYNRAARLVDELEMNGVIGPSEGSKPRKVLWQAQPEEELNPPEN